LRIHCKELNIVKSMEPTLREATSARAETSMNGTLKSAARQTESSMNGTAKPKAQRKPNYAKIHARKLPLEVYPLPAFQPHNPLSLLPVLYAIVKDFIMPRSSHAQCPYQGYFSSKTRSVHVTDQTSIRALWEAGFFGKGTLSRSEPNWLASEKRRLGMMATETAEEYSVRRRKDRDEFKRQRARIEKEMIEEQRQRENDGLTGLPDGVGADQIPVGGWSELCSMRIDRRREFADLRK
jgi:hypothetical protein